MSADHPCQRCGACCAHYRVSFYWGEADPGLPDSVPIELTEPVSPYRIAMRGTLSRPVRCIALEGTVGESVSCLIYPRRASPCREVEPFDDLGRPDEKCLKARATHGLPPLPGH